MSDFYSCVHKAFTTSAYSQNVHQNLKKTVFIYSGNARRTNVGIYKN